MGEDTPAALGALRVDETKLRGHVDEVVRSSVEETLNALLDRAIADSRACGSSSPMPAGGWSRRRLRSIPRPIGSAASWDC